MKKLIFLTIFISIFILSGSLVLAEENCDLALPRYLTVVCRDQGVMEDLPLPNFNTVGDQSESVSQPCLSNCKINENQINLECDTAQTLHYEVWIVGESSPRFINHCYPLENEGSLPVEFDRNEQLKIIAYCRDILSTKHPIKSSSIVYKQLKIMLEEAWAGSSEYVPIQGTEGCSLNNVVDKYKGDTKVSSWINPNTGYVNSKPSSTYSNINEIPTNWKVGDSYACVKDWETGIATISLTYDKDKNSYWCGGLSGSRKIYSVEEIESVSGKCYAIPISIYKSNIECCFPSDCSWKGTQYTCNPDTWSCEETRWCDSQLNCDQVFGEGICQNNKITKWKCNFNEPWGDHLGTCEKEIRNVIQCPNDCSSSEYYNQEEGKCKPRNILLDCPSGKCCVEGGSYKPKECSSGQECCLVSSSYIGVCKDSCVEEEDVLSEGVYSTGGTGMATFSPLGGTGLIVLIIVILIAVGGVIFYFFYWKPKKGTVEKTIVKETPKFCKDCGAKLRGGTKFCNKCGKAV